VNGGFSWTKIKAGDLLLIPNLITLVRLLSLPFILYFLLKNTTSDFIIALILMGIAYFSDMIDGWVARKLNQESDLGKILDPLVDKLAIGAVAIYTVIYKGFPLWALVLILSKDILILLGGWYLLRKKKVVPQPNKWGKYTVALWGVILFLYLIELSFWKGLLLWVGVVMILITFVSYFKMFLSGPHIEKSGQ
jgi:cardiolipin synthase